MIEDHVTSLDLSKQLYEAGIVIKDPVFWWCNRGVDPINYPVWEVMCDHYAHSEEIKYPAPLSSEIGIILRKLNNEHITQLPTWDTYHKKWFAHAGYQMGEYITLWFDDMSEPNLRVTWLIYLKGKGIL